MTNVKPLHRQGRPVVSEKDPAQQGAHTVVAPADEKMQKCKIDITTKIRISLNPTKSDQNLTRPMLNDFERYCLIFVTGNVFRVYHVNGGKSERSLLWQGRYPLRYGRIHGCNICKWRRLSWAVGGGGGVIPPRSHSSRLRFTHFTTA